MHNPLLDTNVRERTWYDIAEELQERIAWVARKSRGQEAFKWLNVLDLIDSEASAYWREWGMDVYAQRVYTQPIAQVQAQEVQKVGPAGNPILDLLA